jgi:hypothetical protein
VGDLGATQPRQNDVADQQMNRSLVLGRGLNRFISIPSREDLKPNGAEDIANQGAHRIVILDQKNSLVAAGHLRRWWSGNKNTNF